MKSLRVVVVVLAFLAAPTVTQMVRQCSCAEVQPCVNSAKTGFMTCADACQNHVSAMGASYAKMRACIVQKEDAIRATMGCTQSKMSNSCASSGASSQVPKRFPETLKLAAYAELNSMLQRSGIQAEAKAFLSVGKKFANCLMKCMDRSMTGSCYKKLGCGLALPSDKILVQSSKQCAIQSGFNTAGVREMCNCIAGSGIRNLAPLCSRIVIT